MQCDAKKVLQVHTWRWGRVNIAWLGCETAWEFIDFRLLWQQQHQELVFEIASEDV